MRSLLVITMITLLLSTQAIAKNNSLRASKTVTQLSRVLAIPTLGIALAFAPLQQAAAQAQPEEALIAVGADEPAWRHGAMLLRASIPPAEGEEKRRGICLPSWLYRY